MFPLDWQRNLIADGCFTVEGDRSTVVKLGDAESHCPDVLATLTSEE